MNFKFRLSAYIIAKKLIYNIDIIYFDQISAPFGRLSLDF